MAGPSPTDALIQRFHHHPIVLGMVGGFLWGALMRSWMRYISTDPEFSWSGTGFILGASTIVGTALGIAWLRRERQGRGWWRLLGFTTVLVGSGAGIVMVPSFLIGAAAFGRTSWRRWIRAALAIAAIGIQVAFFATSGDRLPTGRAIPAYAWYAAMITFQAYALSVVFRPPVVGVPTPARRSAGAGGTPQRWRRNQSRWAADDVSNAVPV